ncbi:MAG: hypothetical protein HC899_09465 [Leptolyngbyaceae cyanobacterium SM1_4_3]|nr:hypothetical protein [Leptolyngbyaceae cyanobacterium SM1_4_3]
MQHDIAPGHEVHQSLQQPTNGDTTSVHPFALPLRFCTIQDAFKLRNTEPLSILPVASAM